MNVNVNVKNSSKPRPNSEPALLFFFFRVPLGTNGEVYLFALSQQPLRAILGTPPA